jgi:hypothetical protein
VFHDWKPERLFVIVTVYIDESGTHDGSPVMVLAGQVAKLGQWVDFDARWRRLLKREGVEYFHAKEFRSRSGPFAGWSPERSERFLRRAEKIISKFTFCGFTTVLDPRDYQQVYRAAKKPKRFKNDSKYGLCFRLVLLELPRLIQRSLNRDDLEINFVLELGDPGSGDAVVIFEDAKRDAPEELSRLLGVLSYGEKRIFPGLQAADLIAFGAFRREQRSPDDVISLPKGYTVQGSKGEANYHPPVFKFPFTAAVINELLRKGIADIEDRRRFWREGWVQPD